METEKEKVLCLVFCACFEIKANTFPSFHSRARLHDAMQCENVKEKTHLKFCLLTLMACE